MRARIDAWGPIASRRDVPRVLPDHLRQLAADHQPVLSTSAIVLSLTKGWPVEERRRQVGPAALNGVTRIMGFILISIGAQLLLTALGSHFGFV